MEYFMILGKIRDFNLNMWQLMTMVIIVFTATARWLNVTRVTGELSLDFNRFFGARGEQSIASFASTLKMTPTINFVNVKYFKDDPHNELRQCHDPLLML